MSRVQSIERAFAVSCGAGRRPDRRDRGRQRVGVPKSTAARMLTALRQRARSSRSRAGRATGWGPAWRAWRPDSSRPGIPPSRGRDLAEPTNGGRGRKPDLSRRASRPLRRPGRHGPTRSRSGLDRPRVPMHGVSSGQTVLAGLAPAAIERYLAAPLEAFTPATMGTPRPCASGFRSGAPDGYAWTATSSRGARRRLRRRSLTARRGPWQSTSMDRRTGSGVRDGSGSPSVCSALPGDPLADLREGTCPAAR